MTEEWYNFIEEPVREIVRALRNAGINTECSCGHDMTIQCALIDPTAEFSMIHSILIEMGHKQFQITSHWDVDLSLSPHCWIDVHVGTVS